MPRLRVAWETAALARLDGRAIVVRCLFSGRELREVLTRHLDLDAARDLHGPRILLYGRDEAVHL